MSVTRNKCHNDLAHVSKLTLIIVFSVSRCGCTSWESELETRPRVKHYQETERLRAEGSRLGGQSLGEEAGCLQEPTCTATEEEMSSGETLLTTSCQLSDQQHKVLMKLLCASAGGVFTFN